MVNYRAMSKTRLARECAKLDPEAERAFAEEGLSGDLGLSDAEEHWQAEVERRAEEVLEGRAELEDADLVHERLISRLRALKI
jgi:hypothetical protein